MSSHKKELSSGSIGKLGRAAITILKSSHRHGRRGTEHLQPRLAVIEPLAERVQVVRRRGKRLIPHQRLLVNWRRRATPRGPSPPKREVLKCRHRTPLEDIGRELFALQVRSAAWWSPSIGCGVIDPSRRHTRDEVGCSLTRSHHRHKCKRFCSNG